MSTYDASASFSLRSSLPALRNTLAIPPSPSAARFFCSSTRDVTFCLIPPNNPEAAAPPLPAFAAEPLPVLIGRSVSPTMPADVLEVLLLLFVGMLPLHRRVRVRRGPVETAECRACPPKPQAEAGYGSRDPEVRVRTLENDFLSDHGHRLLPVRCERAVVGARAQHVRAGLTEGGLHGDASIRRHRRRHPHRRPGRIRADARVFPRHDLLGRKRDRAGASIDEPRHVEADRSEERRVGKECR